MVSGCMEVLLDRSDGWKVGLDKWWVATAWFVSAPSDVCTIAKSFDAFPPSASLSLSDV